MDDSVLWICIIKYSGGRGQLFHWLMGSHGFGKYHNDTSPSTRGSGPNAHSFTPMLAPLGHSNPRPHHCPLSFPIQGMEFGGLAGKSREWMELGARLDLLCWNTPSAEVLAVTIPFLHNALNIASFFSLWDCKVRRKDVARRGLHGFLQVTILFFP